MLVHFADFDLNLTACHLSRAGQAVSLERRPTEILCLLAAKPGELITRHELALRVWGAAAGVDADMGLNTAIRKIRLALNDSAVAPRFIETVQGRGYRFIAPLAPPATPSPAQTLAVLPFDNLGNTPDHDYLADGFTEEMIAALGALAPERLRVLGRRSVAPFRHASLSPTEIGQRLGALYLLEGSIRSDGNMLRITIRLLHAPDGRQLWSASCDGEASRLLILQSQVSQKVAASLRDELALEERPARPERHSRDEAAYHLYLRGRHAWNRNQSGMTQESLGYFKRAVELAPGYALAWSGLADAYSASPINSDVPALSVWQPASQAAQAALHAGPDLAEAVASLGFVRFWLDWRWQDALALFQRAAALDPNYAFAHRMVGIASSHLGLHAQAATAIRRAVELDPLFAMHHALSAVIAYHAGNFPQAASFARDAIEVDPKFWIGHLQLAHAMEQCGEPAAAFAALDDAARLCGNSSKPSMLRGYLLGRLGRHEEARAVREDLETAATQRFVPPVAFATIHLGLGEPAETLAWLRRAVAERDVNLAFLPVDRRWQPLRSHPDFAAILETCGFHAPGHPVTLEPALHTVFSHSP
jgi:TolB-like protein/Flp pilus assembly protein TadD